MAAKPISLRVAEEVKLDLEQIARRFGTSAATLGADFVTQGVRATKHPSIELRQTPVGRMAYIRGVHLPVWLAVETPPRVVIGALADGILLCVRLARRQTLRARARALHKPKRKDWDAPIRD